MDEQRENCYFWLDARVPEDERTMSVMCVKCHDEKFPALGWLWEGSKNGYGPHDYVCDMCGHVIKKAVGNTKLENEEQHS